MMASHGIICWADSAKECYEHTVGLIADAAKYLNAKMAGKPAFGGQVVAPNPDRAAIAADLMPACALYDGFAPQAGPLFGRCRGAGIRGVRQV
jgi:rhamnose utilization protein RhaD (predicted bifunctional aldolase and dehydrogenase)